MLPQPAKQDSFELRQPRFKGLTLLLHLLPL